MKSREGVSACFRSVSEDAGLKTSPDDSALIGGDARTNAARILSILGGLEQGPAADMILLNAGAALHFAGEGSSLAECRFLASGSLPFRQGAPGSRVPPAGFFRGGDSSLTQKTGKLLGAETGQYPALFVKKPGYGIGPKTPHGGKVLRGGEDMATAR